MPARLSTVLVPTAFVLIWSTGFVVARLVVPHADPLTFLTIRTVLAALLLAGIAVAMRAPWPAGAAGWRDAAVTGVLLHTIYLGGIFWAIKEGLPAGITALIAGAQPLCVAILAGPLLAERIPARRWAGVAAGLAGIALVLSPRFGEGGYRAATLLPSFLSLLAITAGTIWQKRTGTRFDLRSGTAVQFGAAAIAAGVGAVLLEPLHVELVPAFFIGLAWSTLVLSLGAVVLLLYMLRHGAAVGVSSLLFLVPPVSSIMAYVLFGETLTGLQLVGMAVAVAGVALAARA